MKMEKNKTIKIGLKSVMAFALLFLCLDFLILKTHIITLNFKLRNRHEKLMNL